MQSVCFRTHRLSYRYVAPLKWSNRYAILVFGFEAPWVVSCVGMVCYFPDRACGSCALVQTCLYGRSFHTATSAQTRGMHPFVMSIRQDSTDPAHLFVRCTTFGREQPDVAFFFYALVRAGKNGVTKKQGFSIDRALLDGNEVSEWESVFPKSSGTARLVLDRDTSTRTPVAVTITTPSPVRIKARGRFLTQLSWKELYIAMVRRVTGTFGRYGQLSVSTQPAASMVPPLCDNREERRASTWIDSRYVSRSQNETMRMGGLVGSVSVNAELSPFDRSILVASEVLHVGKNTSFGLGEIAVSQEDLM